MASKNNESTHFQITYRDAKSSDVCTLKARTIVDSSLGMSFIAVSNFIFDTGSLLVKPVEEQMQKKFELVKTLHLAIYSVISIEEVGEAHKGLSFKKDRSNLVVLPSKNPTTEV